MSTPIYEKGTIKVVWIENLSAQAGDPNKIYSKMFKSESEAVKFAKDKKDCIIFSLISQKNMEEFSWNLLPYGRYKLYMKLLRSYRKHKESILIKLLNLKL